MSLHHLAKEVQSKGRGNDKMLMHVTPREVAGLQAIAKANGGSLTVNPDTGLVEAGFLDNILPSLLPTIAGVALASTGIGAPAAAMLVGGGYGLATGSVEKGLMAGLGAYGGAGIGEGLAANATAPVTEAATAQQTVNAANSGVIPQAPTAAPGGFQYNAANEMVPADYSASITGAGTQPVNTAANAEFANWQSIGSNPSAADLQAFNAQYGTTNAGTSAATGMTDQQAMRSLGNAGVTQGGSSAGAPTAGKGFTYDQLKSGYSNTELGPFVAENYGKIGMAAAPAVAEAMEQDPYMPEEYKRDPNALRLSKNFRAYTPATPNPYYRPTGLGYAAGGDVKKEESSLQLPTSGGDGFGQIANLTVNALEGRSSPNDPVARLVNAMQGKFGSQPQAAVTGNSLEYQIDPRTGAVYVPTGLGYAMGGQVPQLDNMMPGGLAALQGARDGYGATETPYGNIPQLAEGGVPKKPKKATATGARNLANMEAMDAAMAELNNARHNANMSQATLPKSGIAQLGELPYAMGGTIGAYSDGGQMLKGPGDGMSDSIPARISDKQPARLADGEFVVPADVVSHLGNGSTDAGAKRLYAMMDKVRMARTGKKKQAPAINAKKAMPV